MQVDREISRVVLEAVITDAMMEVIQGDLETTVKGLETAMARTKTDLESCEKQMDRLFDMRLNEQITETEYVSKKHSLVNRQTELKGKLTELERSRNERFEPDTRFVLNAKQAAILIAEGKTGGKARCSQKNRFELSLGG